MERWLFMVVGWWGGLATPKCRTRLLMHIQFRPRASQATNQPSQLCPPEQAWTGGKPSCGSGPEERQGSTAPAVGRSVGRQAGRRAERNG